MQMFSMLPAHEWYLRHDQNNKPQSEGGGVAQVLADIAWQYVFVQMERQGLAARELQTR